MLGASLSCLIKVSCYGNGESFKIFKFERRALYLSAFQELEGTQDNNFHMKILNGTSEI